MKPEYGRNHEQTIPQSAERSMEKERLFANLKPEEQTLAKEFTSEKPVVAREKIVVSLLKKTLPESVRTYLEQTHPELITEAVSLFNRNDRESAQRLYELAPSYQWSANLIRQTSIRKAGYFVRPRSAEQNNAWLLEGLRKSIEGTDGMRTYKKYNWRDAEERYYGDLLDSAGTPVTWDACSPEDLHRLELSITKELQAGTMPFRVREYLTLRLPSILSASTIELLQNPPEITAPPGLVSDLKNLTDHEQKIVHSTPEEIIKKLQRRAETNRARFPKLVDQNMKKALIETIFSESLSADQLRQDPILRVWVPTEKEMAEIQQKTHEKTERLLQKLREPSSRTTFAEVNEDLHPPHSVRLAHAPVPTDTFIVLQKIWPICLEQKGFFDAFDPKKLTSLLQNNIPDRHYRSFITKTFTLAKEHGHLTIELVQTLATVKYDDQLLQNFWEIVEHDPQYAPIILGKIRDPRLRELLFAGCNIPPIATFVADNILSMAGGYRLKCQNLDHKRRKIDELEEELSSVTDPQIKIEKERVLQTELRDYVEAIREAEELSTYAEQNFQSVEDCLKTGVMLTTNNFGDAASPLEATKELAFLVTSSNDALAEKVANAVERQLASLTAKELEATSYSKTLAHDRLFAALITRCTPEQEVVLHEKLADYLRPYGLHEDTHQLARAWKASFSGPEYKINLFEKIGENLSVIHAIEKRFPSGCKILLEEFGIKNFARYGAAALLKQLEERNDTTKTYGTVLFPGDDYNGAFYQKKAIFEELLNQLQKEGIALRITEARTGLQAASQNRRLQQRYGQASFCFAGGHGSEDGLALGSTQHTVALPVISRQDLSHERVKRSGDFLKDGSQIILVSCSTGKEGGFAQKLSETYGRNIQITGPNVPTSLKSIKLISTNPIRFEVEYSAENTARGYAAGTAL